ncbi:DNA-binding response regulator [Nitrosomonas sp. HPC101]|uniref:response regulator n=1 Tax=Nitrosomonas sp. HPC101 TaxID=1658667 RepID=UPI00136E652B|nr:response regulator transcription factor [Nitrosomonas sp. HPC101]MXS85906.1 DNA-binding response regulator [Nitrosomonas sp. HPC101]
MPIKVICADKHEIFRQGLAALLNNTKEITLIAQTGNGRKAWELTKRLKPDIAIVDIHMPEMNGIEVSRKICFSDLATQVILLTALEDPIVAIDAQEAGVFGYVLKNNSFEDLLTALHTVVAGGTFLSATIRAKLRERQRLGIATVGLSPREREVVRLIALGKSGKEIARIIEISPRTVDTYRNRLMDKLQAHNVVDVVRYAIRAGMVE